MRAEADDQEAQRDWLVRQLRAHMRKQPKRRQLTAAAGHAHDLYEINAARLATTRLACGPGCASCCNAQVGVEMAEAFVIVEHLRENHDAAALEALLARVAERADQVGGLDPAARWAARRPCVFLDQETGNCTIYAVRPLACRGYNSTDRRACEAMAASGDAGDGIPADGERLGRARLVRQALAEVTARAAAGSDDAGETAATRELHGAVTEAAKAGDALGWLRQKRGKHRS